LFPENMETHLNINDTSLSNGELYTIITNKTAKGRKDCLVAIVSGTKADAVNKEKVDEKFTNDFSIVLRPL